MSGSGSLTYCDGDLFASSAEVLVCPTNTLGVMGAGLAKEFAKRFPSAASSYTRTCREGRIKPGTLFLSDRVLMFPTKRHWRDASRLEDIVAGLAFIAVPVLNHSIQSLAVPALGCGLGGLDWEVVRLLMEHYLGALDIPIEIYPPKER